MRSWAEASRVFCVGLGCGLPFLLPLSIMDLWMKESGISHAVIGYSAICHLPFTFKFLLSPLVHNRAAPLFFKMFGKRRGWTAFAQVCMFCAILCMAFSAPADNLWQLLLSATAVSFFHGLQDVILYTYPTSSLCKESAARVASMMVLGYRIGILLSRSGMLYMAFWLGWRCAYIMMAFLIACSTFLVYLSPDQSERHDAVVGYSKRYTLSASMRMLWSHSERWMLIVLLLFLRAGDAFSQKMIKPFLLDVGFSMIDIANALQLCGYVAVLLGSLGASRLIQRLGMHRAMLYAIVCHCITHTLFLCMCYLGKNIFLLYIIATMDGITGGALSTVFVAFLYTYSKGPYPGAEYAFLWGMYELFATILRVSSGYVQEVVGWEAFFVITQLLFVPGIVFAVKYRRL